jgi:hypothetical protein
LWTGSSNFTLLNCGAIASSAGLIGVALVGFVRMYSTLPHTADVADENS